MDTINLTASESINLQSILEDYIAKKYVQMKKCEIDTFAYNVFRNQIENARKILDKVQGLE